MADRYPWSNGNRVELLVEGEQFIPEMLQAITEARQTLLLEFYMVGSGDVADLFIEALIAAVRRGVTVCWLIDGFGGRMFHQQDRDRLSRAGIEVRQYNHLRLTKLVRNLSRDHRKLMIVDQKLSFIGGTGISDEYLRVKPAEGVLAWHDIMLRVKGPVVGDMVHMFTCQWRLCEGDVRFRVMSPDCTRVGDAQARVTEIEGARLQQIKQSFVQRVNHATKRVWLATAYFLPSYSVRRSLRQAAQRGVDVRLIVSSLNTDHPWVYHASKRYYRRLLKAGVKIYEYQPSFLHIKLALCDQWVSAGSCNLDHWNLRWNLEANLEVVEPELAAAVELLLQGDMSQSQEVLYQQWRSRPWHQKLREAGWSLICQLLLKIR